MSRVDYTRESESERGLTSQANILLSSPVSNCASPHLAVAELARQEEPQLEEEGGGGSDLDPGQLRYESSSRGGVYESQGLR